MAVTVVGTIAAAVAIVPIIVIRFAGDPYCQRPTYLAPADPDAIRTMIDETSLMLGMTGLVIFVAGLGLAATLGSASLGAAVAVGLVLFAVPVPLWVAVRSIDSQAGVAVVGAGGLAVAVLAAVSRWRAWLAGGACALVGVLFVAMRPLGQERVSAFLAGCLLVLALVAVISTVAAGTAAVADHTRIPAVFGTVAEAIQLGLAYTAALVWHRKLTGDQQEPGFTPPVVDPLTIGSGIALLLGGLLVVALRLIRTPAAPAPDPDQAVPAAR